MPARPNRALLMAAFLADHQLAPYAHTEAALTHKDPLAGDVAAATIRLCRALIRGTAWPAALQAASTDRALPTVAALTSAAEPPVYRDGFAPHVLQAAVHFVHIQDQFGTALEAAFAFAGPANYCPVLVGAIGGARWGAGQIGASYLSHCKVLPQVCQTADRLAQAWSE